MTQAAGKTGMGPTVMVAVEQHFPTPQRIIDDHLASAILPFHMRMFVRLTRLAAVRDWMVRSLEQPAPGIWGGLMCRKRYIDEQLIEAAPQIDAVVNLGAGFDTRCYRLPELTNTAVWEVDLPGNIAAKRGRVRTLFGVVPAHITLVPLDFNREELGAVLPTHGYTADRRTFFIWEGVTQYLTEASIRSTFNVLATAAAGSRVTFTYVRKDFLDGHVLYGQEDLYKKYVLKDKLWRWGMDPHGVSDVVEAYGWRIVEHAEYSALAERYVTPTGRTLASTPIEQLVYAEKW